MTASGSSLTIDGVVGHFSVVVCLMGLGESRWCFSAAMFPNSGGLRLVEAVGLCCGLRSVVPVG